MALTADQKLIWLGLKTAVNDDTFSGDGSIPTNDAGDELTTEDGTPLAGIRIHKVPGYSYDGVAVPAGTTEVFGLRVEFSDRAPIPIEDTTTSDD